MNHDRNSLRHFCRPARSLSGMASTKAKVSVGSALATVILTWAQDEHEGPFFCSISAMHGVVSVVVGLIEFSHYGAVITAP